MLFYEQTSVSVALGSKGHNLKIELEADSPQAEGFDFKPFINRIKQRADHQSLNMSFEQLTQDLSQELEGLSSLTVWELDRRALTINLTSKKVFTTVRSRNLELRLQGCVSHQQVSSAVDAVFKAAAVWPSLEPALWGNKLFQALKSELAELLEVTVDLGSQKALRLADDSQESR